MAVTRAKRQAVEAGVWRQWGDYWRSKSAERNIDTRDWVPEDALQVAPFTAAVLVLAKTVSASEWIVERIRSDGEWERVPARQLPAWLEGGKRPNRWQSAQDFRKMLSLNLNLFGNALAVAQDRSWNGGWPNQMVAYPWSDVSVSVDGQLAEQAGGLGLPGYGKHSGQVGVCVGRGGAGSGLCLRLRRRVMWFISGMRRFTMWSSGTRRWLGRLRLSGRRWRPDALAELGFLYGMQGPGILAHKGKPGDGLIETTRKYLAEVMRNPQNRHSPLLVSGEWTYHRTQASQSGDADDGAEETFVVVGGGCFLGCRRSCWAARIIT